MDDALRQRSHLCRSCLERTFQYPPYAWNGHHVGIAFDQQRIGNASVVPDRFDTLTAARFPPIALPCACSLYMFLVQQTQNIPMQCDSS